jgi:hypothetical protein
LLPLLLVQAVALPDWKDDQPPCWSIEATSDVLLVE